MKRLVVVALTVFGSLIPLHASAQYVDRDDNVRFEEEFDTDEFMIVARSRAIGVPSFMLGIWLEEHANHWSEGQKNFSHGGEFTWRRRGEFEIGVAVDWADLSMPDAFWLEKNEPSSEMEWTTVDMQFLSVVFFTNWFWNVQPWFSPYVGVGIGPGIVLGEVLKYNPRPGTACRQQANAGVFAADECFGEDGQPDLENDFDPPEKETSIPPVLPVLNLTGGLRFNIARHGVLKLEVGFQDYLFAGAAIGAQW